MQEKIKQELHRYFPAVVATLILSYTKPSVRELVEILGDFSIHDFRLFNLYWKMQANNKSVDEISVEISTIIYRLWMSCDEYDQNPLLKKRNQKLKTEKLKEKKMKNHKLNLLEKKVVNNFLET